jgi:sugar (pentulose or hexulose) kinase
MLPHGLITGYLGIDIGTQGLSVTFTDQDLSVIATGEASYDFVGCLDTGCYEQRCEDWDRAIHTAMISLREKIAPSTISILCVGISGQMHGEVLVNKAGEPIQSVRLWCDARNEEEGHELTKAFGCKVPKRATVARFLWTIRNRFAVAVQTAHVTTPAGWVAYRLTGEFSLGIGDAAGMFPIDGTALDYDFEKLKIFDRLVNNSEIPNLKQLLPQIRKAGEGAGLLTEQGAALLGIRQIGIRVAAAEGDQVAALAGSLIGNAGTVSCCFGTSVCANVVGDRAFTGVCPAVDHFCAADGKPINMVWLRNGTTFLNTIVQSYTWNNVNDDSLTTSDSFSIIMQFMVQAPDDCGGLLALPFMDDEPGLEVSSGGSALIVGWNPTNATVGNVAKAALLSSMFNLLIGCDVLRDQGFPRNEIVLTGGLSKTKECGQILCDVFDTPVSLLSSAEEGCAWGAAVIAKYRYRRSTDDSYNGDWATFLDSIAAGMTKDCFVPDPEKVAVYSEMFQRYKQLITLVPEIRLATALI